MWGWTIRNFSAFDIDEWDIEPLVSLSPRSNMGEAFSRLAGYPLRLISKFVNTIVGVILSQVGNDYLIGMVVWVGSGTLLVLKSFMCEYLGAYIFLKIFTSIRLGEQEIRS